MAPMINQAASTRMGPRDSTRMLGRGGSRDALRYKMKKFGFL